jgi:hypothetical protein
MRFPSFVDLYVTQKSALLAHPYKREPVGQIDKLRFLNGKSFDTMVLLAACYTFFLTHGEKIAKVLYEMAKRCV